MTEQIRPDAANAIPIEAPKAKPKRDIFHFSGEKPTAINLEHVTHMAVDGNKITFNFYSNAIYIELADPSAAESVFKALLNAWSAEA